jgi:hypothetical protein
MRLLALSLSLGWVGAQDYSICSHDPQDLQLTAFDADPPAECNTVRAQALPSLCARASRTRRGRRGAFVQRARACV